MKKLIIAGRIISILTICTLILTTVSVINLVSSSAEETSTQIIDEFDTLNSDWSFGEGISYKEIIANAESGDSALRIAGAEGANGMDFVQNAILHNDYNAEELNVSQTVEFKRNDTSIIRWGIGLIAASDTSNPDELDESGNAYGAIMQLANSESDADHYYSYLAIFKIVNGEVQYLADTVGKQEWTIPGNMQRLQFDVTNEGGVIQLDAKLYLYSNGKWLEDPTHNISVVDYDNPIVDAGYQGMVYRHYPNFVTTGNGRVDIFKYTMNSSVPPVTEGSFLETGKASRLLFQRPATSEDIKEQASMTMQFDSGLTGKYLTLSFMLRDVTSDTKEAGQGQPGWTDACGGYQDYYFTKYDDPAGEIVDPDVRDCDLYTFYIKGTDDLKFKIGMFGYTYKTYITDIKLVETDENHNPINGINLADEYADFSDWSFFKYSEGQSGYIKFSGATALTGKLYDIPEGFFTTWPEPLEEEQMIYHVGNSGWQPHLIQYVRVPYNPGQKFVFTGKCKSWSTGSMAVRVGIHWRGGGIDGNDLEGYEIETDQTTGEFKITFTMPESFTFNGETKATPRLDDGRVLLQVCFQPGTSISTFAQPSFKAVDTGEEYLFNTDFKLGFNGWNFLPSTLGGIYRSGEILYETPDTYYSGAGTGGEAQLMEYDANMFWADTNEDYLPDYGVWWSEDMIKDEDFMDEDDEEAFCTVQGTVVDSKGNPVSGVTVALESDTQLTTKTDSAGYFIFKDIDTLTYSLYILLEDGTTVPFEEYIFGAANKIFTAKFTLNSTLTLVEDASLEDDGNNNEDIDQDDTDELDENVDNDVYSDESDKNVDNDIYFDESDENVDTDDMFGTNEDDETTSSFNVDAFAGVLDGLNAGKDNSASTVNQNESNTGLILIIVGEVVLLAGLIVAGSIIYCKKIKIIRHTAGG